MMPRLGTLDVEVGGLDQLEEDVLDVLADVAGLGERRRVGDRERDVEDPRQRLGEQGLAAACGAEQQDVALGQLDVGLAAAHGLDALVVVVHGDGQRTLGLVLADDVVVQDAVDVTRLGQLLEIQRRRSRELLVDDLVAQVDALVADVHARAGDELLHLPLRFAAEAAEQLVVALGRSRHRAPPSAKPPSSPGSPVGDDVVDDSVVLRFGRAHEVVALRVAPDLVDLLTGVVGDDLVQALAEVEDFACVDLDVGGLALVPAGHLMDEHAGVREREALALRPTGEEQRAHAHGAAHADGAHIRLDELHRVVDREPGVHAAAGLLMYMLMSLSGSSLSRWISCATMRLAISSTTGVPRKMTRSLSSREKMSKDRSPRLVCSITNGTSGVTYSPSSLACLSQCGFPASKPSVSRPQGPQRPRTLRRRPSRPPSSAPRLKRRRRSRRPWPRAFRRAALHACRFLEIGEEL